MMQQITKLLEDQNIDFRISNGELITHCLFNDCDIDSRGSEAHLYINEETGQFMCHKCGESGGITALLAKLRINNNQEIKKQNKIISLNKEAEKFHSNLPPQILDWLINERLLLKEDIDDNLLGYGDFYGKKWITFPVFDALNNVLFFKLRKDPFTQSEGPKYISSGGEASIYNIAVLNDKPDTLVICEGELDTLVLKAYGVPAISSTAGAMTFKDEWLEKLSFVRHLYIVFDKDATGEEGTNNLISKASSLLPLTSILKISLPEALGNKADVTDYFKQPNADPTDLFEDLAIHVAGPEPIDTSKFQEMNADDLADILDQTIKQDKVNKQITFLCMLSAYTEDGQLNCSYNAPSSTGKTYIPTQIAQLFPEVDVLEFGGASPTAFYHDGAYYDKERRCYIVNLERKILIFLEQPNPKLQENLRPVLSHDKKEISYKITDKNQRGSNRDKHIVIRGFPATIFCSAMRLDEQEATRAILLSPETSKEKVLDGIHLAALKHTNKKEYLALLASNTKRLELIDRILAIKQAHVHEIIVPNSDEIEKRFLKCLKSTKPRNQRDITHLLSIIKALTLFNVWFRYDLDGNVISNQDDIDQGFSIWQKLYESQELNLPPYVYDFYNKYILPIYIDKNSSRNVDIAAMTGVLGVSRKDLNEMYYEVEKTLLNADTVNRQILPMLEAAGVIRQLKDPNDKRSKLIYPIMLPDVNNMVSDGGTELEGDKNER